jgi:tyrosyl-tRNA synthetase
VLRGMMAAELLRRLADAGHRAVALAAGATGMIGDPGAGRRSATCSTTRRWRATLRSEVAAIATQARGGDGVMPRPPGACQDG